MQPSENTGTVNQAPVLSNAILEETSMEVFTIVNGQNGTMGTSKIETFDMGNTPYSPASLEDLSKKFGKKIGQ